MPRPSITVTVLEKNNKKKKNGYERITNDGRTQTNLIGDTPGRQKTQRRNAIRKEQDTLTTKIQNDTTKSKTTLTRPTEY